MLKGAIVGALALTMGMFRLLPRKRWASRVHSTNKAARVMPALSSRKPTSRGFVPLSI